MHDIYSSFLAPILPLLIKRLGLSYSLAGMLAVFKASPLFDKSICRPAGRKDYSALFCNYCSHCNCDSDEPAAPLSQLCNYGHAALSLLCSLAA